MDMKAKRSGTKKKAPPPAGVVGKRVERKDGLAKVDGEAEYADDIVLPGMLHAAVATSEYPHAWLDFVDTTEAEEHGGVVAVMTAADLPGQNQVGVAKKDQPLLADKKVRWYGDRLALVAAETPR